MLLIIGCFFKTADETNVSSDVVTEEVVPSSTVVPAKPQFSEMVELWEKPNPLSVPPTAVPNGVVVCTSLETEQTLSLLDVKGNVLWSVDIDTDCSTKILTNGEQLWVGVGDTLRSYELISGKERWSTPVEGLQQRPQYSSKGVWRTFERHGETLLVGAKRMFFGVDLNTGEEQWRVDTSNLSYSYFFQDASGLVRTQAGSASPFHGYSSSRWGQGFGYLFTPLASQSQTLLWSREDIESAIDATELSHFVSTPLKVSDHYFWLIQRNRPSPPTEIRYVTSKDGHKQAIGGSRSRPKPAGLSLLRWSPEGDWRGVDVSAAVSHPTLAIGALNDPKQNLLSVNNYLLFSTTNKAGDVVVLQAWSSEQSLVWQKNERLLLAVSGSAILAGWDTLNLTERRNSAYMPSGEMTLYTLNEDGDELGAIKLPWPVFSMPYSPSCNGYYCYLTSPQKGLVAVQIPYL